MSCSPHLKGVQDPLEILRIISEYHVLRYSEPSQTFYTLRERGWVTYTGGCWCITDEGHKVLSDTEEPTKETPERLPEFFEL